MWEKVILSVLFVTILGLQFANSLTCLSCDTLDSCLQPSQQVCNDATANASSLWLATMHADVPFIAHSDKFKCMNLTYAFNPSNIRTHEFLGCFHQLNISHSNTWYQNCHVCDWESVQSKSC
ncbi:uncharacterized protein LOC117563586 [Drosophila albomicans]|uniref:Uncharacterized protein LOC117563586 n=1 Tax=Drosophila albomicans TaxID=7291 RepID=A0A6P8WF12_DROAB|nr:uncharacterized protein LOC117563586 [Drosophila albomicans]